MKRDSAQLVTHLVFVIFLSLYSFMMNSVACPEGSMTRGYLLNLCIMMAFSVQRSSAGRELAVHLNLSSALERYYNTMHHIASHNKLTSTRARSGLYDTLACCRWVDQELNNI